MSTDKRNSEEEKLRNMRIGIFAATWKEGRGTFQYTYSLIEALANYSKISQTCKTFSFFQLTSCRYRLKSSRSLLRPNYIVVAKLLNNPFIK